MAKGAAVRYFRGVAGNRMGDDTLEDRMEYFMFKISATLCDVL